VGGGVPMALLFRVDRIVVAIQGLEVASAVEHVGDPHPVGLDSISDHGAVLERYGAQAGLEIVPGAPAAWSLADAFAAILDALDEASGRFQIAARTQDRPEYVAQVGLCLPPR